jgi:two-component system chemotaxis response regulator CheB
MIPVLIVDDSCFMRKALRYLLESDAAIKVVGTAADGKEAVRKVKELRPAVVLLDIEMSVMDGLSALAHVMAERPTPVVVLTGVNTTTGAVASRCLERGAVDFIAKPSGTISYNIGTLAPEIIAKVKVAARVDLGKRAHRFPRRSQTQSRKQIVIIGASTGGTTALLTILPCLPRNLDVAFLVVQHMSHHIVPMFVERLKWECSLDIALATEDEVISPGRVLIAPGDRQTMIVTSKLDKRIRLTKEPSGPSRPPSVDSAMESGAAAYGEGTMGVLLSGIGNDGAQGMKSIKYMGGSTIAQDQATSLIFGMPKAAIDLGCVDQVVPLPLIAQTIVTMI